MAVSEVEDKKIYGGCLPYLIYCYCEKDFIFILFWNFDIRCNIYNLVGFVKGSCQNCLFGKGYIDNNMYIGISKKMSICLCC